MSSFLDIQSIRKDFPILARQVYGKPLVYLDNAATTQKPMAVIRKIEEIYSTINANIHRGVHYLSREATEVHEEARKTVQRFINARSNSEIVFTKGTTEAINLVASSFCRQYCREGDEIIISGMEHHSNIVPWQMQAEIHGLKLKVIPLNEKGELRIDVMMELITEKTRLISLTYVSNVLGTINPVGEIIEIAHHCGVPVLIDAAQAVQHLTIDVQGLDCDFLVFSGHKVYAPTGTGVLYGKEKLLDALPPYQGGGEMIASVSFDKTVYNGLPFKFEAGTPDYVGSSALASALDYLEGIGMDKIIAHEEELLRYATTKLNAIEGMKIYGTSEHKSGVISFLANGIHHYDMGMLLDRMGIAVRTGHHCAQPLMHLLGVEGTVRASFVFYNTKEEIDMLVEGIEKVQSML